MNANDFRPNDVIPVGKLPMNFLAGLLGTVEIDDERVLVGPGIGLDAAVIDFGDRKLVVKNDPITFATEGSPHYLVNVNANDLACLGAEPRWMMVTALLPEGATTPDMVSSLFTELSDACYSHGISLVGGHTEITAGLERPILVGMLLGEAANDRILLPGGAHPGDRLVLTHPIAVEGTALIARELRNELAHSFDDAFLDRCADLLTNPGISITSHAKALLDSGGVTAMHDPTEGGLASGIREIAVASGCGAIVNRSLIPILPETEALCAHLGLDPLGLLASGSLLAAVRPERLADIEAIALDNGQRPVVIGKLAVPERGFEMVTDGSRASLPTFSADEYARLLSERSNVPESTRE